MAVMAVMAVMAIGVTFLHTPVALQHQPAVRQLSQIPTGSWSPGSGSLHGLSLAILPSMPV